MRVFIPSALHSYTGRPAPVTARGVTVDEVMRDLDRQFPGLRFRVIDEQGRIRPHMKIFINADQVCDLSAAVGPRDELSIVMALSGG